MFAEHAIEFSSFSYLIGAVRIFGGALGAMFQTMRTDEKAVRLADTKVSTWMLNVPDSKRSLLLPRRSYSTQLFESNKRSSRADEVDELMISAYIIIHNILIMVHKRLSHFAMVPNAYEEIENTCITPRSLLISFRAHSISYPSAGRNPKSVIDELNLLRGSFTAADSSAIDEHTSKCLASAEALSQMISLSPTTIMRRTPFFSCAITMSMLVHLTACVWDFFPKSIESQVDLQEKILAKERIKMGIGSLTAMSRVWGTAAKVLVEVKEAARIVFQQRYSASAYLSEIKSNLAAHSYVKQEYGAGVVYNQPLQLQNMACIQNMNSSSQTSSPPVQQQQSSEQYMMLPQQLHPQGLSPDATYPILSSNTNSNKNPYWSTSDSSPGSAIDSQSTSGSASSAGGYSPYSQSAPPSNSIPISIHQASSLPRDPGTIQQPIVGGYDAALYAESQYAGTAAYPYLTEEDKDGLLQIGQLPTSFVDENEFFSFFGDDSLSQRYQGELS